MNQQDQWLTAKEVAAIFRVDTRSVNRWASQGKLEHRKTPGGRCLFDRAVVMAFLAGEPR